MLNEILDKDKSSKDTNNILISLGIKDLGYRA